MKILGVVNIFATYAYLVSLFTAKPNANVRTLPVSAPRYKKLVFILLDGLRVDGALRTTHKNAYANKMPALYALDGYRALSVCSNPTLTSTRVRSMVNGSPSSFLEGLCAFSHFKSACPNFFDSVAERSVVFFGDETWTDLFGVHGKTYNAYGKNFRMDLEIAYMDEFVESVGKADVLVGHFSALDNHGHFLTLNHPTMTHILGLFNNLVAKTHAKIDNETLLVITSDHGATDNGDHGGASAKERSSFVYFVDSARRLKTPVVPKNVENDWIGALDSFDTIDQADIFPTICALIGAAIPFNSFGNLIPALVTDPDVYVAYALQKMAKLGVRSKKTEAATRKFVADLVKEKARTGDGSAQGTQKATLQIAVALEKFLSQKMHQVFYGIDVPLVYFSVFITFLSCAVLSQNVAITISNALLVFVIVMVSHSVHSFIHEDLIWTLLFLFGNCTPRNAAVCAISSFIGKHPQHSEDRWVPATKIRPYAGSRPWLVLIMFMSVLVRRMLPKNLTAEIQTDINSPLSLKKRVVALRRTTSSLAKSTRALWDSPLASFRSFKQDLFGTRPPILSLLRTKASPNDLQKPFQHTINALRSHLGSAFTELTQNPLITFILFKYFFPSEMKGGVNLDFLLRHPSLDTLLVLVYDPPGAFFLVYLLPLLTHNSLSSHYSLIQIMFFSSGMNYDLSSIDTALPHIFSTEFYLLAMIVLAVYYFFYVRIRILRVDSAYLALSTFHALVVQITTYVTHNEAVYFYFFVGRCFFLLGFFVLENALYLTAKLQTRKNIAR